MTGHDKVSIQPPFNNWGLITPFAIKFSTLRNNCSTRSTVFIKSYQKPVTHAVTDSQFIELGISESSGIRQLQATRHTQRSVEDTYLWTLRFNQPQMVPPLLATRFSLPTDLEMYLDR